MTYNKEYIGERIQRKRNSLNITQEQLAEMINTSKKTISNVERGENPPSVEFIVNICNVLGEDPNYYILGEIPKDDIETYNNTLLKLSPQERKFICIYQNYMNFCNLTVYFCVLFFRLQWNLKHDIFYLKRRNFHEKN